MTNDEINIAIAESCGWIRIHKCMNDAFLTSDVNGLRFAGVPPWKYSIELIPDYCHDLNAMHEAWNTLDEVHKQIFIDELYAVTPSQIYEDRFVGATARQRAEAFLRTIGKWKE